MATTVVPQSTYKRKHVDDPYEAPDAKKQRSLTPNQTVASLKAQERIKSLVDSCDDVEEQELVEKEMKDFKALFERYLRTRENKIEWSKINTPPQDTIADYAKLPDPSPAQVAELASKLVVMKLNGGLGTSMGCVGPKSVIPVTSDGLTFLDLVVKQIEHLNKEYESEIPLVLMNSFNTDKDTAKIIQKYDKIINVMTFNQSRYPRINKETLEPLPLKTSDDKCNFYPPGHGDIFQAFYNSGELQKLIDDGKEFLFLSNVDNLAATVDFKILKYLQDVSSYLMEVTPKTLADVKGGTLIQYEGHLKLLEIAQVPKDKINEFKSITKFKIFNTNNLWIRLKDIKKVVESKALATVDIIENIKQVKSTPVIQLETAAGAAIQCFDNAKGMLVPRTRFRPVKTTNDLFLVQSDIYSTVNGRLVKNPARVGDAPVVRLGPCFKHVGDYKRRLKSLPNIMELSQLFIDGDVVIGKDVTLKGRVFLISRDGKTLEIPDGAQLNNVVSDCGKEKTY